MGSRFGPNVARATMTRKRSVRLFGNPGIRLNDGLTFYGTTEIHLVMFGWKRKETNQRRLHVSA
jgi:hypothetical protein